MIFEYGDFKGNKWMRIRRNEKDVFPFQFGLEKARLIVANYEAIKQFAEGETK